MALVGLGLVVVTGTGCGSVASAPQQAEPVDPGRLLIGAEDVPGASATAQTPPEVCGPLPVLGKDAGKTAISRMLLRAKARIIEALGVFERASLAKAAYARLNSRERLNCIRRAIETFGAAFSVRLHAPRPIDLDGDAVLVRYVSVDDSAKIHGYSDVISLRIGRCTASLLVAVEGSEPSDARSTALARIAAGLLYDDCSQR